VPADRPDSASLARAISTAMHRLYSLHYATRAITVTAHIRADVVFCIIEDHAASLPRVGREDPRVVLDEHTQDEFTAEIEHLTGRRVVAFLNGEQRVSHIACELFFLEPSATT
jgi:hypothetical protein